MKENSNRETKRAIFSIDGATCPSCVFAIEHTARKISGITEAKVDVPNKRILVDYEGDTACLDKIKNIVDKLGYSAELI